MNEPNHTNSLIVPLILLILALLAAGCGRVPTAISTMPLNTPDPTPTPQQFSPTSTTGPTPTITPTFILIDSGLLYTVVGLVPGQTLPIYLEPSLSAGITGEIPPSGKSIQTTGIEVQSDDINWLQVLYQGSAGWVDLSYLARQQGDLPGELVSLAQYVAAALKEADYYRLEEIINPQFCLHFSPYPYLRSGDLTLCPEEIAQLQGSSAIYTWGQYDGSGEPIELTFDDYHQRFVYDQDYFQPELIGLNQEVSSGNAINNIPEYFPDGMIVEYHFTGFDPQYGGMDWRSLRMVFMQVNGDWYLVALVHGEWTI